MAKGQKRAMFVWLPNFAMTLARLKQPQLAGVREPLALLEKHGAIKRIAALDEPAVRAGLYLRQPLADALAVYPGLACADADPDAVAAALTTLAVWAQRYSPATAPALPCGLWLDITGCALLWGGEDRLCENLIARLEARGVPARAAVAPTFGAAYALAHHAERYVIVPARISVTTPHPVPLPLGEGTPVQRLRPDSLSHRERAGVRGCDLKLTAILAPLPIERLRISEATASMLRKLGLAAIGDVQKQPRAGLARRFPDLLPQLDKATGLAPEAIAFLQPPTPWIERLRLADPIAAPEDLERATHKLLHGLCVRLQAQRQGGKLFEASFFRADGGVETQLVKTALPVRDAERIFRLFREKLGLVDPGFGVDVVTVAALHVEALEVEQANILRKANSGACAEELAVLIDALENRLGDGRVYRLSPRESYIPERAVKKAPPIDPSSWPPLRRPSRAKGATLDGRVKPGHDEEGVMAERPIRLFLRPQPIDVTAAIPDAPPVMFRWRKVVHRVVRADGPERIAPEWWRADGDGGEDDEVRDYYRVESSHGMRFWVFREGLYGGERLPRWYLHGVFA
jgi:protein ImuB